MSNRPFIASNEAIAAVNSAERDYILSNIDDIDVMYKTDCLLKLGEDLPWLADDIAERLHKSGVAGVDDLETYFSSDDGKDDLNLLAIKLLSQVNNRINRFFNAVNKAKSTLKKF